MARKRGMQFIPYDYEAAYNKAMEDMHEWFIENLFQHRKKVIYALKEITAGDQFEIEIYPQFRSMDEVPPEGRTIKKDNNKAQKNLNDKNARKYVERLINENFSDRDIWMTLTYDDTHLPPDGDVDAAIKNVQKYIRRINYQRKKRGLPNAKYVYVTAYNPDAEIRWHHHIVMDGALDMETVESCWKQSSRNEVRRLQTDENGLSGMANYIVEEKNRVPSEKRWNSSQGLRHPRIKVVHSKRPETGGSYKKIGSFVDGMVKDRDSIPEILKKWYPDMDFTNANVYYNDFNCIPANGYLMKTDMNLLLKEEDNQVTRLREALEEVADAYDYCICDCGRLLDMVVINILISAELIIAPVKVGGYEIEALQNLEEQIEDLRDINPDLRIKALMTMRQKNKTSLEVEEWLKADSGFDMFVTPVRRSIVAEKSTTAMIPLPKFSKRGIVSQDYRCVVHELLKEMEG